MPAVDSGSARLGEQASQRWQLHVKGKSQCGAWVLVHSRSGYRIEQVISCGDVDPVKKLRVIV